ncbi:hypothetical protein AB8898_05655 [Yersinia enterocolitica]|uniref:hypothetical protein n=1 Tax=Yersinia enterocolitica TaxID=630 RepID=UPI003D04A043
MYKNNDEVIACEAKKLLDEGIYTDTEQAYLEAEKRVIHIREQVKQHHVKQQFKLKIKSIKKKLSHDNDHAYIPYSNNKKYWGD